MKIQKEVFAPSRSNRRKTSRNGYLKSPTIMLTPEQVHLDLQKVAVSYAGELSPSEDFKWQYLLDSLLSKYATDAVSPSLRQDAAIAKMMLTETKCALSNKDGIWRTDHTFSAERFNTVIVHAQTLVSEVMGEFSYEIFARSKFSSGASTSRRRPQGDPYHKYTSQTNPIDVTERAYPYAVALIRNTPAWSRFGATMKIVSGNRIFTVPKKTEIDRCCAKEPDLNLALQRSCGLYIKERLLSQGIDLSDQTRNQRLALRGSRYDELATIDLSSASDSISTEIVKLLLPPTWFHVLDDLRSHSGMLPNGNTLEWSKFSSMGNGFTFELESLLFYCLTKAVLKYERGCGVSCPSTISIYGDDIICPTVIASSVISVLDGCGFSTNEDKTFTHGPFRESCGKHYFDGIDVTPIYIKDAIDSYSRVIWLCNRLRIWSFCAELSSCDDTLYALWRSYSRLLPSRLSGGCNIENETSLYSPGKAQDKLSIASTTSYYRGDAAYLRAMQSNPSEGKPLTWLNWLARAGQSAQLVFFHKIVAQHNVGMVDVSSNTVIHPRFFRYSKNRELQTPRTYLFSKEM